MNKEVQTDINDKISDKMLINKSYCQQSKNE